jgi:hypothetical protein
VAVWFTIGECLAAILARHSADAPETRNTGINMPESQVRLAPPKLKTGQILRIEPENLTR